MKISADGSLVGAEIWLAEPLDELASEFSVTGSCVAKRNGVVVNSGFIWPIISTTCRRKPVSPRLRGLLQHRETHFEDLEIAFTGESVRLKQ